MSIRYIKQDITTIDNGIIGHGVNCLGKMGSGVALAIKNKWPEVYNQYVQYCNVFAKQAEEKLGIVQTVDVGTADKPLVIANCFTQVNYGHDGKRYANKVAVEESLSNLVAFAANFHMPVYIPKIGCGLGGLNFEQDVQPILETLTSDYPAVTITVCEI